MGRVYILTTLLTIKDCRKKDFILYLFMIFAATSPIEKTAI